MGNKGNNLSLIKGDPWRDNIGIVKQFIEQLPNYERLCEEIEYIIKKRLKDAEIEYSSVASRAKTINSFLDKIQRKYYANVFQEVTDFAGVRVVCLYINDIVEIEKIIGTEFYVIEKVDKLKEKQPDQFGYGAIHFIIKLNEEIYGARYEDLKNLVCEVQVRTILQDSWAIIDHHLVYKKESSIPKSLQRKLNSLAGFFESADCQFEQIRADRNKYLSEIHESFASKESFLENEVNADSLREFLIWKFPNVPIEGFSGQLNLIIEDVPFKHYSSLRNIDDIINQTLYAREKLTLELKDIKKSDGRVPAAIELVLALCLIDNEFYKNANISDWWRDAIKSKRSSI